MHIKVSVTPAHPFEGFLEVHFPTSIPRHRNKALDIAISSCWAKGMKTITQKVTLLHIVIGVKEAIRGNVFCTTSWDGERNLHIVPDRMVPLDIVHARHTRHEAAAINRSRKVGLYKELHGVHDVVSRLFWPVGE